MQHTLITPQSPGEQLAALAAGALDAAARQQTGNIGSTTWHNDNGTRTVIGPDAGSSGIAPWVGDTTAPSMPTGVSVDSAAGMILVTWDGSLQDGIPADFDHIQVLVDGTEAGQLRVQGTVPLGPYEAGSVHQVTVRAWDDAHAEDGSPAPNGSDTTTPISVTVKSVAGADEIQAAKDKAQKAINQASKAQSTADGRNRTFTGKAEPSHDGLVKGDVWYQQDDSGNTVRMKIWDGTSFNANLVLADGILVPGSLGPVSIQNGSVDASKIKADEALLKKILVRKLLADEIDVGSLAAAIIRSNKFLTSDGRTGFDDTGFWAKDTGGNEAFRANANGVSMTGVFKTNIDGRSRFVISQKDITTPADKRSLGAIQYFNGQDNVNPILGITAWDNNANQQLTLGPGDPNLSSEEEKYNVGQLRLTSGNSMEGKSYSGATIDAQYIILGHLTGGGQTFIDIIHSSEDSAGSGSVDVVAEKSFKVNYSFYTPHINVPLEKWIDFYPGFSNYVNRTRLDIAGGMCYMTVAVQGSLPDNQYTQVAHIRKVYPHAGMNVVCTMQYAYAAGAFIGSDTDPEPQVIQVMNHSGGPRTWAVAQFIFPYDGQLD